MTYDITISEYQFDVTVTGDDNTIVTQVTVGASTGGGGGSSEWGGITGTLSAQTDLQAALDAKQAVNANLTTISALSATNDDFLQRKAGAWASRGVSQVKSDLGLSGNNTGDQTSIVGITGTLAEFNAALTGDNFATGGGTATGTNTGDETAAGILAKLITVDGAGSGLDADLLDGQSSAAFATAAQGTLAASASQPGHTHTAADVSAPGSTTQFVFNSGGVLTGAANVEYENNQLRLEAIASPVAPASGGVSLFGRTVAGRTVPAFLSQDNVVSHLMADLAREQPMIVVAQTGSNGLNSLGSSGLGVTGTATTAAKSPTNIFTNTNKVGFLALTPATNAIGGFRTFSSNFFAHGDAANTGGFKFFCRWGPATGMSNPTHRGWCGMSGDWWGSAPSDVDPSSRARCVGMGWDAADSNVQIMHNDGSGACTKVDLGASFPVPTTDNSVIYELSMYAIKGTTPFVYWEVLELVSGAVGTGTLSTNLPTSFPALSPYGWVSAGGTSSVAGFNFCSLYAVDA